MRWRCKCQASKRRRHLDATKYDTSKDRTMAGLAASSSSSSSSSSSPLLTGDEIEFNRIRPEGSPLPYGRLGHFSEEAMNELATDWNLRGESKGIMQSIWNLHPSNPKKQQYHQTTFFKTLLFTVFFIQNYHRNSHTHTARIEFSEDL